MIKTFEQDEHFHVTGTTPNEIHSGLDTAVELAQLRATDDGGRGILVTRHRPDLYSVALNARVQFVPWQPSMGFIDER